MAITMNEEQVVKNAVADYFKEYKSVYTQFEKSIQIGHYRCRADVAIYTKKFPRKLVAIVECKKEGSMGKSKTGIEQLQSYLCASDTCLGIFVNSLNPTDWIYMENLGNNIFVEITQNQFIVSVITEIEEHKDIQQRVSDKLEKLVLQEAAENLKTPANKRRIQAKSNYFVEQEARKKITPDKIAETTNKLVLQKATENLRNTATQQLIQQLTNDYIEHEARKNMTPGKIASVTINMSAERIKQLETEISKLRRYRTWGWILAVLFFIILLVMFYN